MNAAEEETYLAFHKVEDLPEDSSRDERTFAAIYHNVSIKVQEMLTKDPSKQIRSLLARNQCAALHVLKTLAQDIPEVRSELAGNKALPSHLQVQLSQDPATAVQVALARRSSLDPKAQVLLAGSKERQTCWTLLYNPSISNEALQVLAKRKGDKDLRLTIASRGNLPHEVQAALSRDLDPEVREALHANLSTQWDVDFGVAYLQEYAPDLYQRVLEDVDPEVVQSLQEGWTGSLEDLREAAELVNR